ncbi:hypothetical protein J2S25_000599 [Mesobacillus stamsii]|uniref:Uncharacterized protein n=1 Tax=Mesobacillus stamsii TaxID=225347 RepID=A0ABU0FSW0_9BACI|nr:hypothetical protein [Mesobacillus stamsii]
MKVVVLSVRAMMQLPEGEASLNLYEAVCLTEGGDGSREKGGLVSC